jgi:hypothetical protein
VRSRRSTARPSWGPQQRHHGVALVGAGAAQAVQGVAAHREQDRNAPRTGPDRARRCKLALQVIHTAVLISLLKRKEGLACFQAFSELYNDRIEVLGPLARPFGYAQAEQTHAEQS